MNLGIYINPYYAHKDELKQRLDELQGVRLWGTEGQSDLLPPSAGRINEQNVAELSLTGILVFGGDGTILRSLPFALASQAPVLGVNLGHLGFLSDSRLTELDQVIQRLREGKFRVQERMVLRAELKRGNQTLLSAPALNDAVIHKGRVPTLIDIRVYCNRRFVLDTRCDGIVAATPTGSTAYSLSAGGPILSPVMEAFIVSPLNPHILSVRPMVFGADDRLHFRLRKASGNAVLQLDGCTALELQEDDLLQVSRCETKLRFIKLTDKSFYQILRHKLHMGRRNHV